MLFTQLTMMFALLKQTDTTSYLLFYVALIAKNLQILLGK